MKHIDLNFVSRVKLIGIIGTAPAGDGGTDKLHALLGAYKKIQFTPEELEYITVTTLDGKGGTAYRIEGFDEKAGCNPELGPDFACLKGVALEDSQVTWLARQLRDWYKNATIHDLEWFDPLMEALEKPAQQPKHDFKRRGK